MGQVDQVKVFAKSTIQRFDNWISAASTRTINEKLIALCLCTPAVANAALPFDLKEPIVVDDAFFDTTCIKTNMHFPVDWVLLCDAVRTLMKGTICIRKAGLKVRMPQAPEDFMRDMNKLCMAMAAQRRAAQSKQNRKAILRQMKKLAECVEAHARAHRDVLTARRAETDLSEGQAGVIIQRMKEAQKLPIESLWTDRGMSSKSNETMLARYGVKNGLTQERNRSSDQSQSREPTAGRIRAQPCLGARKI